MNGLGLRPWALAKAKRHQATGIGHQEMHYKTEKLKTIALRNAKKATDIRQ
jgi:hypothetical protein